MLSQIFPVGVGEFYFQLPAEGLEGREIIECSGFSFRKSQIMGPAEFPIVVLTRLGLERMPVAQLVIRKPAGIGKPEEYRVIGCEILLQGTLAAAGDIAQRQHGFCNEPRFAFQEHHFRTPADGEQRLDKSLGK